MPAARQAVAAAGLLLLAGACRAPTTSAGPLVASAASSTSTTAPAGYGAPATLGRIDDRAIGESSGLAASRRNPGVLWTHNDSDDDPFVYCVDLRARTCGVWRVTGAEAFDWEDMAVGPGPGGAGSSLYMGDIGDNLDQRTEIVVYRVPEPAAGEGVPAAPRSAPAATARADALRLRYPDGPRNAEALLVHPVTGDLYVVSKEAAGANVYKATAPVDPKSVTTLTRVTTLQLPAASGQSELVTGGDISPDGRRVALCTYTRAYELEVPASGGFDTVWSQRPTPVTLGFRLQGEAIAYRLDGRALLTTSEIFPSPLQQVERR
jgi:hypothetical protein